MAARELGNPLGNPLALPRGAEPGKQLSGATRYPRLVLFKCNTAPYIAVNYLQPDLGWTYPSVALSANPFTSRPWVHPSGKKLFANTSGGITAFSIPDCNALYSNTSLTSVILGISNAGDRLYLSNGSVVSTSDLQIIGSIVSQAGGTLGPVAFSPDDTKIAAVKGVSSNLTGAVYSLETYDLLAETGILSSTPYTSVNNIAYLFTPAFSSDGAKVMFPLPLTASNTQMGYLYDVGITRLYNSVGGSTTSGVMNYLSPFFYDKYDGWGMTARALVTDSFISNKDNTPRALGLSIGDAAPSDPVKVVGDFLISRVNGTAKVQLCNLIASPESRFTYTPAAISGSFTNAFFEAI